MKGHTLLQALDGLVYVSQGLACTSSAADRPMRFHTTCKVGGDQAVQGTFPQHVATAPASVSFPWFELAVGIAGTTQLS